jgi:Calcineurin-like phosphoesterase
MHHLFVHTVSFGGVSMWHRNRSWFLILALIAFLATPNRSSAQSNAPTQNPSAPTNPSATPWNFAASGDSRNCGDVIMPGISASVAKDNAAFYWHLGDFRKLSDFDEDLQHQPKNIASPLSISTYESIAWDDFLQNQIATFGTLPVFLGIGNHELVWPHTREMYIIQFADWLDSPILRAQRLADDRNDHKLTTYFHWSQGGVDFINLDNATNDAFDEAQLLWFERTLKLDAANPNVQTLVVGMHEALPDSISENHAMDESEEGRISGRRVYRDLLKIQNDSQKRVYVLASHSHYYMDGIFNTEYWLNNGGVLPGWIIGTAGAIRYPLPRAKTEAKAAETNVYGYLLATVKQGGEIDFAFRKLEESEIPASVIGEYKQDFVHWCFVKNSAAN